MTVAVDWLGLYRDLIAEVPTIAAGARLVLCGLGACVDARISAHMLAPLFSPTAPEAARAFGEMIKARAEKGIGGEIRVDWPEGPSWLAQNLPISYALGGTGPQAAWSLAMIGAPALVAALALRGILVRDRSKAPGCDGCIRITAGLTDATQRCLRELEDVLATRAD